MSGNHAPVHHRDDNDFVQAGNLYRLMSEPEKQRLVGNIAASLSQVSRKDIIDRSIANFRNADREYGDRVAEAVANRRTSHPTASDGKTPAVALRT
jgi:catalase